MNSISPKDQRRVRAALRDLFSKRGLDAWDVLLRRKKEQPSFDLLSRMIDLDRGRQIWLSDAGYTALRLIIRVLNESGLWVRVADYGDIYSAVRSVLSESWIAGRVPEYADEVVSLVSPKIESATKNHSFLFPFHGISSTEGRDIALGPAVFLSEFKPSLARYGVDIDDEAVKAIETSMEGYSWILLRVRGTHRNAERRAKEKAVHLAGTLAALAACTYEDGASGFRIGPIFSPETAYGYCRWGCWTDEDNEFRLNMRFPRSQKLEVNEELFERAGGLPVWERLATVVEIETPNDVEQGLVTALRWFADAHKEEDPTMQVIKYWTCVEVFFSFNEEYVTKSVADGLAATLTWGPFRNPLCPGFVDLHREVKQLYSDRSKALHRGLLGRSTRADAGKLSQYVAWMLLNLTGLRDMGLSDLRGYADRCGQLARSCLSRIESENSGLRGNKTKLEIAGTPTDAAG